MVHTFPFFGKSYHNHEACLQIIIFNLENNGKSVPDFELGANACLQLLFDIAQDAHR